MEDVRAYQLHLVGQKYSWAHINQVACALRFFYGVTLGQKEAFQRIISGKDPEKLPPVLDDAEIVRFLEAVEGVRNRVALATRLCGGLAHRGSRLPQGYLDRQQTDVALHRSWQRRPGPVRHAVAAASGDSTRLLEARTSYLVAVSGAGTWRSYQRHRSPERMPRGKEACPNQKARDRAFAEAQLRDSPSGEWDRHPHHPGSPRPHSSGINCPLRASCDHPDRRDT